MDCQISLVRSNKHNDKTKLKCNNMHPLKKVIMYTKYLYIYDNLLTLHDKFITQIKQIIHTKSLIKNLI